jgi:hypothetical protein
MKMRITDWFISFSQNRPFGNPTETVHARHTKISSGASKRRISTCRLSSHGVSKTENANLKKGRNSPDQRNDTMKGGEDQQ